jgi:hypothetical protein
VANLLTDVYIVKYQYSNTAAEPGRPAMYLTAFLAEELGRIAQDDRLAAADKSRLARLAACSRPERPERPAAASLLDRVVLAFRPEPASCAQPC